MNRRRSYEDPLTKIRHPTWLVAKDMFGHPIEVTLLEPYADLRAILTAAREARIADGWRCDEIGRHCADFFCTKDGVCLLIWYFHIYGFLIPYRSPAEGHEI